MQRQRASSGQANPSSVTNLETLRDKFWRLLDKDREDPDFLEAFAEVDRLLGEAIAAAEGALPVANRG